MRLRIHCVVASWLLLTAAVVVSPSGLIAQAGEGTSAAALSDDWKRVGSTHFLVVGNASDKDLRATLLELERFRLALLHLLPSLDVTPAVPTICILFKHDGAFTPFKPRRVTGQINRLVGGYFTAHPDVNYMVSARRSERDLPFDIILHEYTHYVVYRNLHQAPAWLHEGLAELYSTFRSDKEGRGIIGHAPSARPEAFRALQEGRTTLMPLRRLFLPGGPTSEFDRAQASSLYYAQAWALTHYLLLGDRRGQLPGYFAALEAGLPVEEAFRHAFGVSFEQMERELMRYVTQARIRGLAVPMQPALAPLEHVPVERMREADVRHLLGDLLMRLGAEREAERELTRALALDPQHHRARASLAGVRINEARYDDTLAVIAEIPEPDAGDLAPQYWRGRALAKLGRHQEAYAAFTRAASANSMSPSVWLELSAAALALDRSDDASAAFERLRQIHADPGWYRNHALRAFQLGRDDVVVRDVEAFFADGGLGHASAPGVGFVGAVAYWRMDRDADAESLLRRMAPSIVEKSWTASVHQFLLDQLPAERFLSRAGSPGEKTEAHAYVGLKALIAGRRDDAVRHLTWVQAQGSKSYVEYDMAVSALEQLKAETGAEFR